MRANPLFSIVIPTYNRAHFISATVKSALAQEEDSFEVIVVDDGSTDDTEGVVRQFRDTRLSYHKQENAERGAARNFGRSLARGEYLNFLDSDDLLLPNHLREARAMVERHHRPEVFYLAYQLVDTAGNPLSRPRPIQGELNRLLLRGNLLSCNGVFLRKDVAEEHPFYEDRRFTTSEDWALWLRLASRYKIYYSNTVTSYIVNHDERSVLRVDEASLRYSQNLLLKHLTEDESFVEKYGRQMGLVRAELLSFAALHLAMGGLSRRAFHYLRRSLAANPALLFQRRSLAILRHILLNPSKHQNGLHHAGQ